MIFLYLVIFVVHLVRKENLYLQKFNQLNPQRFFKLSLSRQNKLHGDMK